MTVKEAIRTQLGSVVTSSQQQTKNHVSNSVASHVPFDCLVFLLIGFPLALHTGVPYHGNKSVNDHNQATIPSCSEAVLSSLDLATCL